jgi:hypothetical protein
MHDGDTVTFSRLSEVWEYNRKKANKDLLVKAKGEGDLREHLS